MQVTAPNEENRRSGFLLFLALITVALAYVVWPFASALLWAMLAAIMFQPLYLWMLTRLGGRENRAAIATLLIITIAVVVPALAIGNVVVAQVLQVYSGLQGQGFDASAHFDRVHDNLPARLQAMVNASGYGDFDALKSRISAVARDSLSLLAKHALTIGGNAFAFLLAFAIGLYVTYFLLRDGRRLGAGIKQALPLEPAIAERLTSSFIAVVRATIKGSIVVGLVQGLLGTITFWIVGFPSAVLLGLLMAIFSLLPAVGPTIVWVPIAAYLLLTGSIWQGVVVIISGALIIGMADNLLRPILVGRDTGIPDWLVLVTTLGGIAAFGLSGIVVGPVVGGLFLAGWSIYRDQTRGQAAVPTRAGRKAPDTAA